MVETSRWITPPTLKWVRQREVDIEAARRQIRLERLTKAGTPDEPSLQSRPLFIECHLSIASTCQFSSVPQPPVGFKKFQIQEGARASNVICNIPVTYYVS